jgi:hypothetical protein
MAESNQQGHNNHRFIHRAATLYHLTMAVTNSTTVMAVQRDKVNTMPQQEE